LDNFVEDETGELYPDWIGLIGCDTILFCLIGGFVGLATGAVPVLYCLIGGFVGPVGIAICCRGCSFVAEVFDPFFRSFANRFLNLVLFDSDNFVSSFAISSGAGFTDSGLDDFAAVIRFLNLLFCALDDFALGCAAVVVGLIGFVGLAVGFVEVDSVFSCFDSGVVDIAFSRLGCCGLAIIFCFLCLLLCALDNFALRSFGCTAGAGDALLCIIGFVFFRDGADETDAVLSGCGGIGVVVGLIECGAGFACSRSGCCDCLAE